MTKIFRNEFPFFISKDIKIRNPPLAWGIQYTVAQCTDTPNLIFTIKQGGLWQTLEVFNPLIAQLA